MDLRVLHKPQLIPHKMECVLPYGRGFDHVFCIFWHPGDFRIHSFPCVPKLVVAQQRALLIYCCHLDGVLVQVQSDVYPASLSAKGNVFVCIFLMCILLFTILLLAIFLSFETVFFFPRFLDVVNSSPVPSEFFDRSTYG